MQLGLIYIMNYLKKNHDYRRMLTRGAPGNNKIVYIPLRFWFNRNAGLALPLIASTIS